MEAVKKEADVSRFSTGLKPRLRADIMQANGELMVLHGGLMTSYDIEPFLPSYGDKATDSAYPHDKSPLPVSPISCSPGT